MKINKFLKIFMVFLLSLSVFAFVSCSNDKYNGLSGIIIEKEYKPAYTFVTVVSTGKTVIPITQYIPNQWFISVEYDINGKKQIADFKITEEEYNSYNIGDIFIYILEN